MNFIDKIEDIINLIKKNEEKELFNLPSNPEDFLNNPVFGLDDFTFDWYTSLKEVINLTDSSSSKNFASQLFAGREESALLAEIASSFLNISMYTYKIAGINSVIEKIVINKLLNVFGLKYGEGIFNPGGSISNLVAMICACNLKFPQLKEKGWFSVNKPVIYASEQAHYSIKKNASILGIGKESVCLIPSDNNGKMICEILEETIKKDMKGNKNPFMIIATSGTTVLGAFDDLDMISKISKKYNLWLHVDGSYGLSVGFSKKRKHFIYGIENANSITFNPHKTFGITQQCSVLLLDKKGILENALSDKAPYLFQINSDYDLGQKSILCGRKNDAIKLWALWKDLGDKGLENRVEKQFGLVRDMVGLILDDKDFNLEYSPEFLNICFNYNKMKAEDVCRKLYERGLAKISYGNFRNNEFIRYTCVNPEFSTEDNKKILLKIKSLN